MMLGLQQPSCCHEVASLRQSAQQRSRPWYREAFTSKPAAALFVNLNELMSGLGKIAAGLAWVIPDSWGTDKEFESRQLSERTA